MDPGFGIARLSLLDRGIVFVIAHIRGGGELGRHWYDDGKKLHKKNTFTDFIAATDWLAQSGWVDSGPDRRDGRIGGRPADGRRRQPRPGKVRRDRGGRCRSWTR